MQLRYVFSELGQGLRRNVSMHVAVVLTLFVSLTLVGLGLLVNQQTQKTTRQWGSELQITAWLCKDKDDNPACTGAVTDAQREAILAVVKDNPEVAGYRTESSEVAFEKVKELVGPDKFDGPNPAATAEDMPESVWIELKDPQKFEGITSAIQGLDGVSRISDFREELAPIYTVMKISKWSSIGFAAVLVVAALLLVANTIRLAAFARRKEIAIMRLVGASTLYIALPFLLEALVTAIIGVVLAAGFLELAMYFGVRPASESLRFMRPWIGMPDYLYAVGAIAILGPILTLLPTLVLTRKYTKV